MNDPRQADSGTQVAIRVPGESDVGSVAYIEGGDDRLISRLASLGASGARVRLSPADGDDTAGHSAAVSDINWVSLQVLDDEDDTEGHVIQLRFPTAEEARNFQVKLLAGGALIATLAVAGTGIAVNQLPGLSVGSSDASSVTAAEAVSEMGTFAREREGGTGSVASQVANDMGTFAREREGNIGAAAASTDQSGTFAREREGTPGAAAAQSALEDMGTFAQEREGGSAAAASSALEDMGTFAREREGGSAGAGSSTLEDMGTFAREREGGSAGAGSSSVDDMSTFAQEREGTPGAAAAQSALEDMGTFAQEREGGSSDDSASGGNRGGIRPE